MLRRKGIIIVLLVGVFCLGTTYCDDKPAKKVDPYANASVLVEAFVVKVSMEALAEAGVSAIGQSPEGVSILNILWCLRDAEMGEVVSGAKLMVGNRNNAQSSNKETFYVKTEKVVTQNTKDGPVQTKVDRYDPFSAGTAFETRSHGIGPDGKSIRLWYEYSETGIEREEDSQGPPDKFSYSWEGNLYVQSGEPVIAGAMQNDDAATFFIITATIQDGGKAEKK